MVTEPERPPRDGDQWPTGTNTNSDRDPARVDLSASSPGDRTEPAGGTEQDRDEDLATPVHQGDRDPAEVDWQPYNAGRPLVLAIVATSALVTLLLLVPFADDPRRAVVLGLLVVLLVLQGVLLVRFRRAGRRSMSPLWLRVAAPAGWMWGFFAAFQYAVPLPSYQPASSSALGGALMGASFAFLMWGTDPGRRTRRERRTASTSSRGTKGSSS